MTGDISASADPAPLKELPGQPGDPEDPEDENPLYKQDEFRMYCLKVLPCSKRYCHDWTTCPFSHPAEKAKRRDPRVFSYTGVACPHMKQSNHCPAGDRCTYAHSVWEYWLHSSRYRTQLCNDGVSCKRKICFFAHTLEELRVSSVKVLNPDHERVNEPFEMDPFAPSGRAANKAHGHGHGRGGPGGNCNSHNQRIGPNRQLPSHGGTPHNTMGGHHPHPSQQQAPRFSMADLQMLTQLHAKLQAATGMGTVSALHTQLQMQQQRMGASGAGGISAAEAAAMEQIMLLQQQRPQQQMDLMHLMMQVLKNQQVQQQHQAAAATAAMAAAAQVQGGHRNPMAAAALATSGGMLLQPQGALLQQQQHAAALVATGPERTSLSNHPRAMPGVGANGGMYPGAQLGAHTARPRPEAMSGRHNNGNSRAAGGRGRGGQGLYGSGSTVQRQALNNPAQQPREALLAQHFAGMNMVQGPPAPPPPPSGLSPIHNADSLPNNRSSLDDGSTTHKAVAAADGEGDCRHPGLAPPNAPMPISSRRTSVQHPSQSRMHHLNNAEDLTHHGSLPHMTLATSSPSNAGDASPAALSLPSHTFRASSSGGGTPLMDHALSANCHTSLSPTAAVLKGNVKGNAAVTAAAAVAGASPLFSDASLSCAASIASHHSEGPVAEEAGIPQ